MSRARRLLGEVLFRLEPRRHRASGPDFVCIGMQKAGTRWLFDQMVARRDVWMPPVKEISFLGGLNGASADAKIAHQRRQLYPRTRLATDLPRQRRFLDDFAAHEGHAEDLDWYRRLFDMKGRRRSGDVSPAYSVLPDARIARAAAALPEARFVLLLREPADRLWSSLRMHVRAGRVDEAVLTDWPRLARHLERRQHRGWFPSQIWRAWSAALPPGRIGFWFFEDIAQRPQEVVDAICRHVGIAPGPGTRPADYNRKRHTPKSPMPPEIAAGLAAFFEAERRAAAETFGGHATAWPDQ